MATTRLISMHQNKGKSTADCLADRIELIVWSENSEAISLYNKYFKQRVMIMT